MGLAPADFGRDPNAAFVKILRDAREPLTARKVIDAVAERGVARPTVSAKWATFQKTVVKFHPNIHLPGRGLYEWRDAQVSAGVALNRLLDLLATTNKVKVGLRDALVAVIRSSKNEAGTDDDAKVRAARERQFKLDALHAVAELAGEVEELAYDSGDPDLIVERLRARVRATALDQLGRPGDEAKFDPAQHEVQGRRPADGAAVTVVRPGYASAEGGTALVLRKALVVAD
jgi:hypothetical protein